MAETGSDGPGVRVPPPLLFLGPFVVGVLLHRRWPLPMPAAGTARLVAGVLAALGLGLILSSLALFHRAHTSPLPMRPARAFVIGGPYRLTRNPMYVGMAALYLGVAAWVGSLWPPLLLPLALLLVRKLVIDREERYLEGRFGAEYLRYRARVRRWI